MGLETTKLPPKAGGQWLSRFTWLTVFFALGLIGLGGLVTSHEAGMAVPDWPTTYGYNMFLFPISMWTGGVFYEHTHRLWASGVGLLTTILAIWMWVRPPAHCSRKVVRVLAVAAFIGVCLQGVLGGLRVTLYKDELGMVHAALAQVFLVLLGVIAMYTSGWWPRLKEAAHSGGWLSLKRPAALLSVLIFVQLLLGAAMRHQHAGLAVPDFPLAYGRIWPPSDAAFLEAINQVRHSVVDYKPITAAHIHLHMTHRLVAFAILAVAGAIAWRVGRLAGWRATPARLTQAWFGIVLLQGALGAFTVWSNKAADIATLHVVVGAFSLLFGSLLAVAAWQTGKTVEKPAVSKAGEADAAGHLGYLDAAPMNSANR